MIEDIHGILKQYWGYSSFRPLQEEIIQSVLEKRDTLALLPTGGGKSICFQVPTLAAKGMALVVSPLIALMEDQVYNLKSRNIPAISLTGNLSLREMDIALENAVNGKYKFVYLSPERLQNELVRARIKRMSINLLAIDEAHCISQWGYDFRPSYMGIKEIRELLPQVPVLALTATATPKVVADIQEKLGFPHTNAIQKSFFRPNLHYNLVRTEEKWGNTLKIFHKIKGSGIIYCRNRRHTVEISNWLTQNRISSDYYHAGLSQEVRRNKQQEWLENNPRIMVCTNAFGMGIDKPDVRLVVHLELPDSLEAYFQEAGRAGRDGETSYSIVIVDPSDVDLLKHRYLDSFPDLQFIKRVYQALANTLQLAVGSGENQVFGFDIAEFAKNYSIPTPKTYQALKILEREGILSLNDGVKQSSRLMITTDRQTLYDYQLRNPKMDILIKTLVRSYGGLDIEYTPINERLLAKRLNTSVKSVFFSLQRLKEHGLMDYIPNPEKAQITFLRARQKTDYLSISDQNLKDRYHDLQKRIESVVSYVENKGECRSSFLLRYFGETNTTDCGHCDVCRAKNTRPLDMDKLIQEIKTTLGAFESLSLDELAQKLQLKNKDLMPALRWLIDNKTIKEVNNRLMLF